MGAERLTEYSRVTTFSGAVSNSYHLTDGLVKYGNKREASDFPDDLVLATFWSAHLCQVSPSQEMVLTLDIELKMFNCDKVQMLV